MLAVMLGLSPGLGGCGSESPARAQSQPETLPLVREPSNHAEKKISLQELAILREIQFQLESTQTETIFEDRPVPSTCTRTVQTGVRSECRTDYRRECRTHYENECRQVSFPVCRVTQENVCRNVPDQVCRTENVPVCHNQSRQVCDSQSVCRTENSRICDSRGCREVPRRVCEPAQNCRTVTERVCRSETRRTCENITRRECRLEDRQTCRDEWRQECRSVPRELCDSVPHQVCQNVPVYGEETYACTETQRVPVGQRVLSKTVALVKVEFANPHQRIVANDEAVVQIIDDRLHVAVQDEAAIRYQIRRISVQNERISETENLIRAHFVIEVL